MTTARQRTSPVSWLTLELYHLGELPEEDHRKVEAQLAGCAASRSCLEQIQTAAVALPPLPAAAAAPRRRSPRAGSRRVAWAGAAAAAAAALILVVLRDDRRTAATYPPRRVSFKGGQVALSLVRMRRGAALHQPTTFAPGDRFKALVTCDAAQAQKWELVVFQGGRASFPIAATRTVTCGNQAPLPGAFEIEGPSPAAICLLIGSATPSRAALEQMDPRDLPAGTACVQLTPASE